MVSCHCTNKCSSLSSLSITLLFADSETAIYLTRDEMYHETKDIDGSITKFEYYLEFLCV